MKTMREQIELPAYWASVLVNGDWSGIEGNIHEGELLAWIDDNPAVYIISCSDMLTYDVEVTE